MTKQLRKAFMRRSRLNNIYNKTRSPENWDNYKKQRNFCVDLLRKTKRSYLNKLISKILVIIKNSGTQLKPFLVIRG